METDEKVSLNEFDDDNIKLLKEMINFYRAGKWTFWILVGLGMLASAITAWITVFRYVKG